MPLSIARSLLGAVGLGLLLWLVFGKKPWQVGVPDTIGDYALVYCWWAALLNLLPLAFLFWTADRWTLPLNVEGPPSAPRPFPRFFFPVVSGAMLVCAATGAARLNGSLWDDEEYSVRRAILGTYRVKDNGQVKLKELPWSHTFWYYTKPTNHVLQSILSRLSLTAWRLAARPEGLQLNEVALRAPGYVVGVLSIGAIALLLARMGFAWSGALAAWLLALHPWHMRLAPEARGYTYVLLLAPLVILFALRALENSRWRWWIALAAAEFFLLYAWPPAAVHVVVLNFCVGARLISDKRFRPNLDIVLLRWLVPGLIAAMVLFVLLLPCIPQFRLYIEKVGDFSSHPHWLKNVASLLVTGTVWSKSGSLQPAYPENYPFAHDQPLLATAVVGLVCALLLAGSFRLLRSGPRLSWLLVVFFLPGIIVYLAAALERKYLYEWYLAFTIPGLVGLTAIGLTGGAGFLEKKTGWRGVSLGVALAAVAAFIAMTWPGRVFLLTRNVQPVRDSVRLTRPNPDPNFPGNRDIITISTVAAPEIYDPLVRRAKNLDDLVKFLKESDERGVPLYANNGFPQALSVNSPEIYALLANETVFELVGHLHGVESMLDRTVHRYRQGSVKGLNLQPYRQLYRDPAAPMISY